MEKQKLPDTELKVMQAIWHIEPPASTSAVREELQKERPWNLSALQTLLGRLVRRGFLQTEKQGKSRYYTPLVTEEDYLAEDSRRYFQKWTGGISQGFGCLSLCQSFGYKRGLRRIEGVYRGRNGGVSGYAYFSGIFEGRPLDASDYSAGTLASAAPV